VVVKIVVLWVAATGSYQRFGGHFCLNLQGRSGFYTENRENIFLQNVGKHKSNYTVIS
jgi:hypothetical protein